MLNKHFDNIYVLYISQQELDRVKHKLELNQINAEYYKGVNGRTQLLKQFNESNTKMKTVGAFGHVHSMINIINDAIDKNYKKILLLEPDIYFINNFNSIVEKYLLLDYKLLYFGASQHNWNDVDKNRNINGYYAAKNTYGTFAIGIDSTVFQEYLEELNKLQYPSDLCLHTVQQKYNNCYVAFPNLVSCDVTKSTTTNRWRSQLELSKKLGWNMDNYSVFDKFTFAVNKFSIYKVVIESNYIMKGAYFKLSNYGKDITPVIYIPNGFAEHKIRICDGKQKECDDYVIYVLTKGISFDLFLNNMFCDNIYVIEFFKDILQNRKVVYNTFKNTVSKYTNSKDKVIGAYYNSILSQLL